MGWIAYGARGDRAVRIGGELYEAAEEVASVARRSVQRQVEFRALLGRHLERHLTGGDLQALLGGHRVIAEVRLAVAAVPDFDTVLDELERARADGTLAASVTGSDVVYDLAEDGVSLRRWNADRTESIGALVDGAFVERPDAGPGRT